MYAYLMKPHKEITAKDAYYKGRSCYAEDYQESLERFSTKYCAHHYGSPDCELCTAWQNGYDNRAQYWVHDHAKTCPQGLAARGNHENCDIDG